MTSCSSLRGKKKLLGKAAATVPPGFTAGNTAFHCAGMQAAGSSSIIIKNLPQYHQKSEISNMNPGKMINYLICFKIKSLKINEY